MGAGAQSWLTLCDPMVCSLPSSSVHGISQARLLEWVAFSFSSNQESDLSLRRKMEMIIVNEHRGLLGAWGMFTQMCSLYDNHVVHVLFSTTL